MTETRLSTCRRTKGLGDGWHRQQSCTAPAPVYTHVCNHDMQVSSAWLPSVQVAAATFGIDAPWLPTFTVAPVVTEFLQVCGCL